MESRRRAKACRIEAAAAAAVTRWKSTCGQLHGAPGESYRYVAPSPLECATVRASEKELGKFYNAASWSIDSKKTSVLVESLEKGVATVQSLIA